MPSPRQFVLGIAPGENADAPMLTTVVTESGVAPEKETGALDETGQSRDQPAPSITRISGGGDFSAYARPNLMGMVAYGTFGSDAVTGDVEPFAHLHTPAEDQPPFTVWRHMFGSAPNRLIEKFTNCRFTRFQIAMSSGEPAMVLTTNLVGKPAGRLPDMPALAPGGIFDRGLPIIFVDYEIGFDGEPNRSINSFTYNLQSAINTMQTDQLTDSIYEPGGRSLEVNYTQAFKDLDDYNRVFYGGPTGATPSPTETHRALVAKFKDGEGATRLTLNVPHFKYGTGPLQPSTSADEIATQEIGGAGDIPPDGGPVTTAEINSGVSQYAAA